MTAAYSEDSNSSSQRISEISRPSAASAAVSVPGRAGPVRREGRGAPPADRAHDRSSSARDQPVQQRAQVLVIAGGKLLQQQTVGGGQQQAGVAAGIAASPARASSAPTVSR